MGVSTQKKNLEIFSRFVIEWTCQTTKWRSKCDVMKFNKTTNQKSNWKFFMVERGVCALRYVTTQKRHLCLRNNATGSLAGSMHSLTSLPDGGQWQHEHQRKRSPVDRSATMVMMVVVANEAIFQTASAGYWTPAVHCEATVYNDIASNSHDVAAGC